MAQFMYIYKYVCQVNFGCIMILGSEKGMNMKNTKTNIKVKLTKDMIVSDASVTSVPFKNAGVVPSTLSDLVL